MSLVGIPLMEQDAIFAAVASVLHLGNLKFIGSEDESSVDPNAEFNLKAAATLLGVDSKGLANALTTRTRQTPDGKIVVLSTQ